jgi:hypothetical protein
MCSQYFFLRKNKKSRTVWSSSGSIPIVYNSKLQLDRAGVVFPETSGCLWVQENNTLPLCQTRKIM